MTPAPMTQRRFGTASNSSAPQESTIVLAVELDAPQRHRLGARGEHHVLRLQRALRAVGARELDLAAGLELAVTRAAA